MLFIVRTDVDSQSGKQRLMGMFDGDKAVEDAWRFIDQLKESHVGEYKVFGNAVEISRPA